MLMLSELYWLIICINLSNYGIFEVHLPYYFIKHPKSNFEGSELYTIFMIYYMYQLIKLWYFRDAFTLLFYKRSKVKFRR